MCMCRGLDGDECAREYAKRLQAHRRVKEYFREWND